MKCRQCGHINEEGARFCEKCGQPLIEESRPIKQKRNIISNGSFPSY